MKSNLTRKIITDKNGHKRTVWVRAYSVDTKSASKESNLLAETKNLNLLKEKRNKAKGSKKEKLQKEIDTHENKVESLRGGKKKESKTIGTKSVSSAAEKWAKKITDNKAKDFPNQYGAKGFEHFIVKEGKKYLKILQARKGSNEGSVFAFIDKETGDVYKPASHSKPAKGIRANVFKNPPLEQGSLYRYR